MLQQRYRNQIECVLKPKALHLKENSNQTLLKDARSFLWMGIDKRKINIHLLEIQVNQTRYL